MKRGPRVVIRYSSRCEKTLPHGPLRRRMELHGEVGWVCPTHALVRVALPTPDYPFLDSYFFHTLW
jgi:hypothetical protein